MVRFISIVLLDGKKVLKLYVLIKMYNYWHLSRVFTANSTIEIHNTYKSMLLKTSALKYLACALRSRRAHGLDIMRKYQVFIPK